MLAGVKRDRPRVQGPLHVLLLVLEWTKSLMTAAELIAELQKLPPETPVKLWYTEPGFESREDFTLD